MVDVKKWMPNVASWLMKQLARSRGGRTCSPKHGPSGMELHTAIFDKGEVLESHRDTHEVILIVPMPQLIALASFYLSAGIFPHSCFPFSLCGSRTRATQAAALGGWRVVSESSQPGNPVHFSLTGLDLLTRILAGRFWETCVLGMLADFASDYEAEAFQRQRCKQRCA